MTILEKIKKQRIIQLENEKESFKRPSFYQKLKDSNQGIIGEIKRASPSKGKIADKSFNLKEKIDSYSKNENIICYSVLTEEENFLGNNSDISKVISYDSTTPILRKDFIFDEFQIFHAKNLGASAILLIAKMLSEKELISLHNFANKLDLDVLVEIHDEEDLIKALKIKNLKLLGINNRNLDSFETDINITKNMLDILSPDREFLVISESGYLCIDDINTAKKWGVDGFLIGEALVRNLI